MADAAALAPMAEHNSRRCGTWVAASLEHTPGREGSDSSRALGPRRARPRGRLSAVFPTSSILRLALGSPPAEAGPSGQRPFPARRGGPGTGAHSHRRARARRLPCRPPRHGARLARSLARAQTLAPLGVCHLCTARPVPASLAQRRGRVSRRQVPPCEKGFTGAPRSPTFLLRVGLPLPLPPLRVLLAAAAALPPGLRHPG